MSSPLDYTAYPTVQHVRDRVASLGVTLSTSIDDIQIQSRIDEVTAEVERECRRQFLPGSPGEVRYFDGSGTGEMQLDDFITITSVNLIGYIGLVGIQAFPYIVPVSMKGTPTSRIQIYQGSPAVFFPIWVSCFPEGRSNIQVTGTWGYGATIPKDLWQAVCDRCAQIVVAFQEYSIEGRTVKWRNDSQSEEYDLSLPEALVKAEQRFTSMISRYRLSFAHRIRRRNPRLY